MRLKTYKSWTAKPPIACRTIDECPSAECRLIEPEESMPPLDIIAMDDPCRLELKPDTELVSSPFKLVELPDGYLIHGVVIDQDHFLVSDLTHEFNSYPLGNRTCHYEGLPPVEEFEGSLLVLPSISSWKNYYHWIVDALPRLRGLEKTIASADRIAVPDGKPFHSEWLDHLEIPKSKRLIVKSDFHVRASQLIVPTPSLPTTIHASAIQWLRDQISSWNDIKPHRKLFIGRADAWRRRAYNEDDLTHRLAAEHGYEITSLSGMSAMDQARLFAESSEVIALHGAAIGNIVFCHPGVKLLELFRSDFIYPQYSRLAAAAGVRYAAHSSPASKKDPNGYLDLSTLDKILDPFLKA